MYAHDNILNIMLGQLFILGVQITIFLRILVPIHNIMANDDLYASYIITHGICAKFGPVGGNIFGFVVGTDVL